MKKALLIFLLFIVFSCNNKQKENIQNNAPRVIETIGIHVSADSLKPAPIIYLSERPMPAVFKIPTKNGGINIIHNKGGIVKIEFTPPITKVLPVVVTDLNWSTMPPTTSPSNDQSPAALGNFTTFTTDQGLALDDISCGFTDNKGNLWFGTFGGGVSQYDGTSFTNYTTAQGLAHNSVLCISQDNKGNLWFGTNGGGVSRYDGKSFTNFMTGQGLSCGVVWSISQDSKGYLWFCTNVGGVSRYDGKSFTNFTTQQGLANNNVRSITEDSKGNLWFGTSGGGVSRYDGKSFTNFTLAEGLKNNYVNCICQDNKEDLWFGTNFGVSRYDGKCFTNFTSAEGLANNSVSSICLDNKGNIWFGTNGGGVSRYDGKTFTNFTSKQGLANNRIISINKDEKGYLWFGTKGGGVSRYDGKSFTNFTSAQGIVNNMVLSISSDSKGDLWFGTYGGGVSRYDGKSFTNFMQGQGLAFDHVWSISHDSKGDVWFGTPVNGVSKYDGKSFINYTIAQGLANNDVRSIRQDNKGDLWFGTNGGGVSRYDGIRVEAIEAALQRGEIIPQRIQQGLKKINGKLVKSFTNFTTAQGLINNEIWSINQDKKGNLWFGSISGGISKYDGISFTNFTTAQGLANNNVYSIMVDKKGNIWVGTIGSGITIFCSGQEQSAVVDVAGKIKANESISYKLKSFSSKNGLAEDNVYGMVEDKDGNIFIGTNLGFTVLKGGIVEDASDIVKAKYGIEYYNTNTGCPVKDMTPNNMFIDKDGILWAGTGSDKTGLVRFDYAAVNKNKAPPEVVIQNIKLNNENICWYNLSLSKTNKNKFRKLGMNDSSAKVSDSTAMLLAEFMAFGKLASKEILYSQQTKFSGVAFDSITNFYPLPENLVLPYEHNNVSFDFNAIEAGKPYLVNYQYILEGYDKEWSPITKKKSASFGNINEGNYTFKLKAQSPEGIWCAPVVYAFKVLPPWWRTWWMYSIDATLIFISLLGIYKWRTSSLRKDKEILESTVVERTKEVLQQKEEADNQRELAEEQKYLVDEKQKEILDSINYAKRIQGSILPDYKDILAAFPNSFVLFKPKDIVSGDFYFFHINPSSIPNGRGGTFIAAGDCTGHGVPGAFMSMLGVSKLSDAVAQSSDTSEILKLLNMGIKTALHQSESNESTRDGMDIALCSLSPSEAKGEGVVLHYAAANRPLYIIYSGQSIVAEIKATKVAIGGLTEDNQHFETHEIKLQAGDTIYLSTDGFADQFNGPKGKKLMTKKFKEILVNIQDKPMKEQGEYLDNFIEDWKAGTEQVDDILVIGVRI